MSHKLETEAMRAAAHSEKVLAVSGALCEVADCRVKITSALIKKVRALEALYGVLSQEAVIAREELMKAHEDAQAAHKAHMKALKQAEQCTAVFQAKSAIAYASV